MSSKDPKPNGGLAPDLSGPLFRSNGDVANSPPAQDEFGQHGELLRILTENANDFIRLHDTSGRSVYASPSVERLYGCQPSGVFEFAHPDDLDRAQRWWRQVVADETEERLVWRVRDRDGAWRWIETAATRSTFHGRPHVLTVCRDITDRKRMEEQLRRSEAELARVARIMMVGELTAVIAHEVNQPLAAVVANSNAASRWLAATPPNLSEARGAVQRIARDAARASEVTRRIRTLVRKAEPSRAAVKLNELVRESVALARPQLDRQNILVRTDLAPDVPFVDADRVQLQQVILNLLMNAMDSLAEVDDGPRSLAIATRRVGSDRVEVLVEDSGAGINPGDAERLFEPFFTRKSEGLGLGLAISRSIIEAHEGELKAEANQSRGARFSFTLPAGEMTPGASAK